MELIFKDGEFQCLLRDICAILRSLSQWDSVYIGDENISEYLQSIGIIEWNQTCKSRYDSTDKFHRYFDKFRKTIHNIF